MVVILTLRLLFNSTINLTDIQCTKEELNLPGYDLVTEQTQDRELLKLKEELQGGKASQAINSKYSFLIISFTTYQRLT